MPLQASTDTQVVRDPLLRYPTCDGRSASTCGKWPIAHFVDYSRTIASSFVNRSSRLHKKRACSPSGGQCLTMMWICGDGFDPLFRVPTDRPLTLMRILFGEPEAKCRYGHTETLRSCLRGCYRGPPAESRLRDRSGGGFQPRARGLPGGRPGFHPGDPARGMVEARGAPWRPDRPAGARRPVQVDGRERLAGDVAPRLQVLRAHAARGFLQGGPRAEPPA